MRVTGIKYFLFWISLGHHILRDVLFSVNNKGKDTVVKILLACVKLCLRKINNHLSALFSKKLDHVDAYRKVMVDLLLVLHALLIFLLLLALVESLCGFISTLEV